MPLRKTPFPYLSYITAYGDEIVISNQYNHKYWECYGREGFVAPQLENITRQYADGEIKTLAIMPKPRNLVVKMFLLGDTSNERDAILWNMASRLIQTGSKKEWGKLKIKRSDDSFVYIDCVYTGGFDEFVEKYPNVAQFELRFFSGQSYFHGDPLGTVDPYVELVYFSDDLYMSDSLYMKDGVKSITFSNDGEVVYPVVRIFGPATGIRIINKTTGLTLGVTPSYSISSGYSIEFDCRENNKRGVYRVHNTSRTDISEMLTLESTLDWPLVKGTNRITYYLQGTGEETRTSIITEKRYYSA